MDLLPFHMFCFFVDLVTWHRPRLRSEGTCRCKQPRRGYSSILFCALLQTYLIRELIIIWGRLHRTLSRHMSAENLEVSLHWGDWTVPTNPDIRVEHRTMVSHGYARRMLPKHKLLKTAIICYPSSYLSLVDV